MSKLAELLNIDSEKETEKIVDSLRENLSKVLKKRGAVIGISGGIDSSLVLALSVKAFGPEKVLGVMLPEKESSKDNFALARKLCKTFNVNYIIEDITGSLEGLGCYRRRDEEIKKLYPDYDSSYKSKIILPNNLMETGSLNIFQIEIISPECEVKKVRLPLKEYLGIVAASNLKQRTRMSMLYYHAEKRNYAVIGTGNKNEHELGFFVKYGDGGADLKPIAHLFKSQVFQIAEYLKVPKEICERIPTTDTYSAGQTQEEFFFRVPFEILDEVWIGTESGFSVQSIAESTGIKIEYVQNIIDDIKKKTTTTAYLRMNPI